MAYNNSDTDNLRAQLVSTDEGNAKKVLPRQVFFKYISYWPLFLLFIALSLSTSYLYLRYKVPVYQSTMKILVKDDSKKSGQDLSTEILSQLVSNGKSNIANELELVRSRTLMERVVRSLGLNTVYYSTGNIRQTELYSSEHKAIVSFQNIADSSKSYQVNFKVKDGQIFYLIDRKEFPIHNNEITKAKGYDFAVHISNPSYYRPNYTYTATWYPPATMATMLAGQVGVEALNKDASIIVLSFSSEIRDKGRDVLNQLATEYATSNVDEKNKTINNTIGFIDDRLLLISGELGNVENDLQRFRQQNNVIDIAGQEQSELDRLKDVRDKLDESDVKLRVADMVATYINDPARKFNLVPSSLGIEDVTLLELVKAYNQQVMQREELLKTVAPGNIAVTSTEAQLEQLQAKIVESVSNVKKAYSSANSRMRSEYDMILQNMHTVPQKEKDLLEISRQQGIKEKLYVYLLEKREESALTKASAVANSIRIDPAITSSVPSTPNKTLAYGIAIALGLGLPLLIIYLRDLFNDKVTTREDITKVTKAPLIGEINHSKSRERKIIANKTRGILPEQFRIIRTNLQYFLPSAAGSTTILITSSMSSEGKTFFSMNFGATLAHSNRKVLLMEFDLRKPKIGSSLGLASSSLGITNYLTGHGQLQDMIKPIEDIENFYLLPSGPIPPNPGELLLNDQLETLFTELKKMFDYIIVDCPPIGIVSDAKVLARFSDMNIYIIRQRYTFKRQLDLINDLYTSQALRNMALVVNDVELKGAHGYYGYGSYYGYGYAAYNYDYSHDYGYNLESEKSSSTWLGRLLNFSSKKE